MTDTERSPVNVDSDRITPPETPEEFFGHQGEATDKLRSLADTFYEIKQDRDAIKNALDAVEIKYVEAESLLFEAIENAGLTSIRTTTGLFSLSDLAWPRIEDRERLLAWAEAEHPELLTLNLQRLQTPLREALKTGTELPPGLTYSVTRKIRTTTRA